MKSLAELPLIPTERNEFHESAFRSYHVLEAVKDLLERKTPPDVVLQIIYMVEAVHPELEELTESHLHKGKGIVTPSHLRKSQYGDTSNPDSGAFLDGCKIA